MKIEIFKRYETDKLNCLIARPSLERFSPESADSELPLLIYLHGAGERGNTDSSIEHLFRHGIPKLIREGLELDAYVLIAQCPTEVVWNNTVRELKSVIDDAVKQLRIKPDRIMITGSSMGGYGTWEMGLTYRNFFAAIAPVAGGGMPWRCAALRTTPVLAYHGALDGVVTPDCSAAMVDAVNRTGGSAALTLLDGLGHNDGIDFAYRSTGLIKELLAYRRSDFGYIPDVCEDCF